MDWRHKALLCPEETLLGGGQPKFSALALNTPSIAGSTAYHLLPCLPHDRLSERGRQYLRVLTRKFSSEGDLFFAGRGKVQTGWVVSPLPGDRLNTLSDKTWIEIIRNNAAPKGRGWRAGRVRDGEVEKSSPATFARDLETATVGEPGRFARLALRFPADANPSYFLAVVQGLRRDPQRELPMEEVTLEELEAVVALPWESADPSMAKAVSMLMGSRADLAWGPVPLGLVATLATEHPDPVPGELHVGDPENWSPANLTTNALNCTRGAATYEIARLLFADPGRLEVFSAAIERIVDDEHPAVRAVAFRCCLAVLETDPVRAIAWALRAAEGHEALLATSYFHDFLLYTCRRHPGEMEPTLQRMLASPRDDVVVTAAGHTVALYFVRGRMEKEARACVSGSTPKRIGAAEAAAAFAASPEHHRMARSILLELVNDEEDQVLEKCGAAFHDTTLDLFAAAPDFLAAYASSRAFQRHPSALLHRLRDHTGSLVPFASCVLPVCRSLAATASGADASREQTFWEGRLYLPGILLRLYEQAQDDQVRELCLDAWDLLLRARVVAAVDLTKGLAAGG